MQLGFPIDGTAEQGDHQSHDTLQNSSNNSSSSHIDASLSPRNTSACPGQAVVTRTSSQARVLSARLQDYVMTSADDVSDENLVNFSLFTDRDPFHFVEASQNDGWIRAMDEEIHSIEKNDTWELSSLSEGKKSIGVEMGVQNKV